MTGSMRIASRFGAALALSGGLLGGGLVGGLATPALAADDPAFGFWLVGSKRAIVEIKPCAEAPEKACGQIVWLLEPLDENGEPKTDVKNENAALRSRAVCGLPIVGDFTREKPGEWDDGFIYDAAEGDLYDAYMEAQDDGTLKVRGFIGIALIGKSQIWTREDGARDGC